MSSTNQRRIRDGVTIDGIRKATGECSRGTCKIRFMHRLDIQGQRVRRQLTLFTVESYLKPSLREITWGAVLVSSCSTAKYHRLGGVRTEICFLPVLADSVPSDASALSTEHYRLFRSSHSRGRWSSLSLLRDQSHHGGPVC